MKKENYMHQAIVNLQRMSRTANGVVSTSASVIKKDVLAVTDGEVAKNLALTNYEKALDIAWENRFRVFDDPQDLCTFIEDLARNVNKGIVKDDILYRHGAESDNENYTPAADLERSASWFFDHLFTLLCQEPYDAVTAAATAEYYINNTIHLFADGCGKSSMITAAWLLMRGNHTLPVYPGRDAYYGFMQQLPLSPTGSEKDRENFDRFLLFYRGMFEENTELSDHLDHLTISLPDKLNTVNSKVVGMQINSVLQVLQPEMIQLDLEKTTHISSVGLRILLQLIQDYENIMLANVSELVYEILDISGFTSMIRVDRKLREITIDGCELLGVGKNGSVYRYSPDTIVKVYKDKNSLDDVRRENQMSRFCFISNLPTAIPLNIVRVGTRIGALYELLNAQSLSHEFVTKPEQRNELVKKYISLLKKIHAIVPEVHHLPQGVTLPNQKDLFLSWVSDLKGVLDQETFDILYQTISSIPDENTLLHGDPTPSNFMNVDNELLIIDLDGLSIGSPVFDLANLSSALEGFPSIFHDDLLGLKDPNLREWILEEVLNGYYADVEQNELKKIQYLIKLCMQTRMTRYCFCHDLASEENRKEELRKLYELIHAYC